MGEVRRIECAGHRRTTAVSDDEPPAGVVVLKTLREREDEEDLAWEVAIRDEALAMLDRAARMIRERGVTGIAISIVFDDGCYGRLTPILVDNMAALIGAVATTQHDLTLRTLTEGA